MNLGWYLLCYHKDGTSFNQMLQIANSPDCAFNCATYVTFATFKFAADNLVNVPRRDWTKEIFLLGQISPSASPTRYLLLLGSSLSLTLVSKCRNVVVDLWDTQML